MKRRAQLSLPTELIVDCFAGGGGASTGIEWALGRSPDIAINHDIDAVRLHERNHPRTRHYCEDVFDVDPVKACGGRPVALAWFSPDCTFHSKARGGKPFRDAKRAKRRRGLAGIVVKWAKAVRPRVLFLENVEEFQEWGPLDVDGQPDKTRKGLSFRRWVGGLRNAGYVVETRMLRACDFGAPTTRRRLFVIARCDGLPIVWPEPTHGPGRAHPYRTAAECVDFGIPCPSIFARKKALADKTMARIARGIFKFVVNAADPFIVPITHAGDRTPHSMAEPLRTITTANRGEFALATPFVFPATHGDGASGADQRSHSVKEPLRTVTTRGAPFHVVAPTLVQTGYGERTGQAPRSLDLHTPLGTVVADGQKHALVSSFLAKHFGGGYTGPGTPLNKPASTVTTVDHHALVSSHLSRFYGTGVGSDLREPLRTVTTGGNRGGGHFAEVHAFLTKYYGCGTGQRVDAPAPTVTSHAEHIGLVTVHGELYLARKPVVATWDPDKTIVLTNEDGAPIPLEPIERAVRSLAFDATSFPIVGLSFWPNAYGIQLTVRMLVPDRDDGKLGEVWRRVSLPWAPLDANGPDHLVRWVRETIANIMSHEVDEALTFHGVRVFDPHRPLRGVKS